MTIIIIIIIIIVTIIIIIHFIYISACQQQVTYNGQAAYMLTAGIAQSL
jgi:hypothetical protein